MIDHTLIRVIDHTCRCLGVSNIYFPGPMHVDCIVTQTTASVCDPIPECSAIIISADTGSSKVSTQCFLLLIMCSRILRSGGWWGQVANDDIPQ